MNLIKYNELYLLAPNQIEELILQRLGIKVLVKKNKDKLYLMCQHYNSCFEVMRKLRYDFDYSVHKKGKFYLLEI